jgi:hypothetical protein
MRTSVGIFSPVSHTGLELDGLSAKFDKLSNLEIDRHGPLVVDPVEGGFRVHGEGPSVFDRIGEEGLQKGLIDIRAVTFAGIGPVLIGQYSNRPTAL